MGNRNSLINSSAKVILKPGREKSVKNRHPWIFSGGVQMIKGHFTPGDILPVYDHRERRLGSGFVNTNSQIRVRLLTFDDVDITPDFLQARIVQAIQHRADLLLPGTDAYRLLHGDGDLLPGLTVDRYGDFLVMQCHSLGIQRLKSTILQILQEAMSPKGIFEKSEARPCRAEGMPENHAVLGGEIPDQVEIEENGVCFYVDLKKGQKTGFFLDQRENRAVAGNLAKGRKVLNCFGYSGGFSVYAALNEAVSTTTLDISKSAIELARQQFRLNGLDMDAHQFLVGNAFEMLRNLPEKYDLIVLDPPAFVKAKQNIHKGAQGYKDVNRLAMQQITSGGLLLTCSCSSYVNWDLFRKIVFSAAKEADRHVQIIAQPGQPFDHPINIFHPEGEYLKTFLLRVW